MGAGVAGKKHPPSHGGEAAKSRERGLRETSPISWGRSGKEPRTGASERESKQQFMVRRAAASAGEGSVGVLARAFSAGLSMAELLPHCAVNHSSGTHSPS